MNTEFLETYIAVAEHGSMAAAARRLNLTPAAIAQRIQSLESEIGAQLLARTGRRVAPTDEGRKILVLARGILSDVRALKQAARQDQTSGELRVGAISTAITGLLPAALHRLSREAPQVELFILPGTSSELYRQVTDGAVDAAVIVEPPFALPKTLDWVTLRQEPLVLICPEHRAGTPPHELLRGEPFIRYDRNNWGGRLADRWLKTAGITPREWLELDQLEAIAVMVGSGLGVSIVPDWARPWPEGVRLAKLPLPGETQPVRNLGFVAQRGAPTRRLAESLLSALRSRKDV